MRLRPIPLITARLANPESAGNSQFKNQSRKYP
jgi:hypothetical protein